MRPLLAFALAAMLSLPGCARPIEGPRPLQRRASLGPVPVEPGAPDVPWVQKTREQRMEYMGAVVHPRFAELFASWDPARYGQFRCQTCHGEDMVARRFRMPAALLPLPVPDPLAAARERDPRAAEFMDERVVPALRELLSAGDPGAAARLGCASCHPAP